MDISEPGDGQIEERILQALVVIKKKRSRPALQPYRFIGVHTIGTWVTIFLAMQKDASLLFHCEGANRYVISNVPWDEQPEVVRDQAGRHHHTLDHALPLYSYDPLRSIWYVSCAAGRYTLEQAIDTIEQHILGAYGH